MEALFIDGLIYLCAAVVAVPVAKRFGLGSVLGYLIAGVLVGPAFGLVNTGAESLMGFAELGVVMMLFLIGLELQPRSLWEMRGRLLGLGGLQVVATIIAVAVVARYGMGAAWHYSITCGLILSLSSTAIVLQTLTEKGLLKSDGGKASFSVLLFQDIAVIPILALLPLLAAPELLAHSGYKLAVAEGVHLDLNLMHGLPGWQVAIINIAAISGVVVGGHYLSRPLFRHIAAARLREIFTAAALLLVLSITALMSLVGLSPALGSFLAGVVLANSEFRHELESNIEPFKGILLGLFFITVGAGIDFSIVYDNATFLAVSIIGLILLKAIILFVIASVFGIKNSSDKWLFTLSLAQAGEFGFVLIAFATQNSVLPQDWANNILVVVAFSMLLTPAIFLFYERVLQPRLEKEPEKFDEDIKKGMIIIAGHGRFGQVVDRMLLANGFKTVVLEYKADVIDGLRKFGAKTFYGDASRPDLLHAAGLKDAKMLVVTIDDQEKTVSLIKYARRERPDIHIIARAWDRRHVYRLYESGADDIVREVFDSSVRTGRYALEAMGISKKDAKRRMDLFIHYDTRAVRKLAQVWDPNISVFENEKYIALSRQLRDEIDQAMQGDANYAPANRRVLRNLRGNSKPASKSKQKLQNKSTANSSNNSKPKTTKTKKSFKSQQKSPSKSKTITKKKAS